MRNLNWFEPGRGTAESEVGALEAAIGSRMPNDFVDFVLRNAGASNPDECEFEIAEPDGHVRLGNFGVLLLLNGEETESVSGTLSNLGDQIPGGLVPVIATGSGDFVCLDVRSGDGVSIVYFFHERAGERAVVPLAATFTKFLDMLREPAEDM